MKIVFRNFVLFVFNCLFTVFLLSCKNPFLANAAGKYQVSFVTNCDTEIDSYRTDKIESIQTLTKAGFEFDGWYTSPSFEGDSITFPYEVKSNITLYAKWINLDNILTINFNSASFFENSSEFYSYHNGIIIIKPGKDKIILKGSNSDLCIKFSDSWISKANIIFDNFSFSSSKDMALIDSPVPLSIGYKGYNELSSSATIAISLVKSPKTIEIKAKDNNSKFEVKTNAVKNSTKGSIGIEADKIIISGGVFVIEGSNGLNFDENDRSGRPGREGASGIKAFETIIQNNATVVIKAGNGGNGSQGSKGDPGNGGWTRDNVFTFENAGNGKDGLDGTPGGIGGLGGTAIKGNLIVELGDVSLFGGNGGSGGKGGEGGDGGKGGDNWAANYAPGNGGRAGDGGKGGVGGNGGDSISGTLSGNARLSPGVGGAGGVGGDPGIPGERGYSRGDWGSGIGYPGGAGSLGPAGSRGQDGIEHR